MFCHGGMAWPSLSQQGAKFGRDELDCSIRIFPELDEGTIVRNPMELHENPWKEPWLPATFQ